MRHSLIAVALLVLPAPLAAQAQAGPTIQVRSNPPTRTAPPVVDRGDYGRDRYARPRWVVAPRVSMDSAVRAVEAKYEGWHVDAKQIAVEYRRPMYVFRMVAGGETGTRELWVDGMTGEALNPQVLGVSPDSTAYYIRWRPPYPDAPTYP